jgi:anti-sigma regulatory factor (Ser/Thr protein kinase)
MMTGASVRQDTPRDQDVSALARHAETFPARLEVFPRVAAFLERVSAAAGFRRDDALRLTLVIEELFTNTVTYGHGGGCEAPVHLALEVAPGRIAVTYEDTAPPFDPLAVAPPPDDPGPLDARAVGGLGLLLVTRLSRDLAYARVEGRNRISLVVTEERP